MIFWMKLFQWILIGVSIIVALLCVLFIAYYFHGSLEKFPTEEQHDKARVISLFLLAVSMVVEAVILFLIGIVRKNIRKYMNKRI